jgi:hypothetical protein
MLGAQKRRLEGRPIILNPILQWLTGDPGPTLPTGDLYPLVFALLGLGAYHSVEKMTGAAK